MCFPHGALAETKQCIDAYEQAQILRSRTKFGASREQLLICSQEGCPRFMINDCARWLGELDSSTPTIVISAKDERGREVTAVKVSVDGLSLADSLDGKALPMDPGPHLFRFEPPGAAPIEEEHVIHQGERNRPIVVVLRGQEPTSTSGDRAAPEGASGDGSTSRRTTLAIAFGAVGAAGVAGFAYFGLRGRDEIEQLRAGCAPRCAEGDVDAAQRKLLIADASLGVGAVSLGLATFFFLSGRPKSPRRPSAWVEPRPIPRGGAATLVVDF
jgi:hypothetical protein